MTPAARPTNRSLWNCFGFDPSFREYYSRWDAKAVRHLDALAQLAGCLEPRLYVVPNYGFQELLPQAYTSYVLTLLPGSYIVGFYHRPSPYQGNAAFEVIDANQDGFRFLAVSTSSTGNNVSIFIPPIAAPLQALSVGVVGTAITITLASDANSNVTSTLLQVQAAIVASGAASALITAVIIGNNGTALSPTMQQAQNLAGGGLAIAGNNLAAINFLFEMTDMSLQHRFFTEPLRDDFLAGIPTLLEIPHPVVTPGNMLCEFWNTSPSQPITANVVLIVAEPVNHDLLNKPTR